LSDKGYYIGLYGVSEKDVRIMVKSFIKWVNEKVEAELEKTKRSSERNRKRKSELENLIDKQRKEMKEIEAKLSELKKNVPYQSIEDAHKSLQEFNKVLQLIEVEIVGVEAKLSMIKQQYEKLENQSGNYPKSTSDLLFQMRLTQEIELAGALARKNAAQSIHKKALDFSNLTEQTETLSGKLLLNQEQLKKTQSIISRYENDLVNPPGRMIPIEPADSKVVIYPIEDE
jgi:chromosome segregation ATPase